MIGNAQFLLQAGFLFLYKWYYFSYFYNVIALSFSPWMQGLKAVNSFKYVCTSAAFSVKSPGLNLAPVVVGTMKDRSCSSDLIG